MALINSSMACSFHLHSCIYAVTFFVINRSRQKK